jgi:hypothetical protein
VKLWPRIARLFGSAGALDEASDQQQREIWCGRAGQRCQAEQAHTSDQQAAAAEAVARSASQKKQRAQWEKVGVDNPLKASRVRLKACADRRQPNVDDRAVDERQARRQDGRRDHQPGMTRAALTISGLRQCSIAKSMNGRAHEQFLSLPCTTID